MTASNVNGSVANGSATNGSFTNGSTSNGSTTNGHVPNGHSAPKPAREAPTPIAIIGMSCRLPGGVASPSDFWDMMSSGRSGRSEFPADRFNPDTFYHPNPDRKDCINTRHGYFIDQDVSTFDAPFFKMGATEAAATGPQHRLLLETAYEALEDAGLPLPTIRGRPIGVYATNNMCDYTMSAMTDVHSSAPMSAALGNACMLSNALSYHFDLRGPSVTVETACSSTLSALHQAAQSLRSGETEMSVVAGCALNLTPWRWMLLSNLLMLNPTGKTLAFDHAADSGYARGEGAGCLILKPLAAAMRDNDRIRSVLVDVGVNHDGAKLTYTTPAPASQAALMRQVYARAGVAAQDVGFVEAHAPGTRVGDPVELEAVHAVFGGEGRTAEEPLLLGSVKSNVGHLESASGIPSVIKVALMLEKGVVPPTIGFERENEKAPLRSRNMEVPVQSIPWPKGKRYAAVNNFGFGGTNAHCVLGIPPSNDAHSSPELNGKSSEPFLFAVSANDETAFNKRKEQLQHFLSSEGNSRISARDLAYTLGQRRTHLTWRTAAIASTPSDLSASLPHIPGIRSRGQKHPFRLAFVFPGQGSQWFGMGAELYARYPIFAQAIRDSDAILAQLGADFSLAEHMFTAESASASRIDQPEISQPATTALQVALVQLLRSWGVEPHAVVGHSSGEIAAAYAAGILSLESATRAAFYRGRFTADLRTEQPDLKGGMLAVMAGAEDIAPLLNAVKAGTVVVGCENSPKSVTVSGDEAGLAELEGLMREKRVLHKRLDVDVPYHSPFLEHVLELYKEVEGLEQQPKEYHKAAFYSTMYGRKVSGTKVKPSYWASSARYPVRFSQGVLDLLSKDGPPDAFVEIGPRTTLLGPVKQILKAAKVENTPLFSMLERGKDARLTSLELAGRLFSMGASLKFGKVNFPADEPAPRLVDGLSPYPWSRSRYWLDSPILDESLRGQHVHHDLLGRPLDGLSGGEMTWKNVLRMEDLPWLRDYWVKAPVFPLAAFVSTAVEAAAKLAISRQVDYDGFLLRDIRILEPLVMKEGARCDMATKLRPLSGGWDEFELSTWDAEAKIWAHHCRGLVSVRKGHKSRSEVAKRVEQASIKCQHVVDKSKFYQDYARVAPRRGPAFQTVSKLRHGDGQALCEISISDTRAEMPYQYETELAVHPTTLDGLFQCVTPLLVVDPQRGPSNVWVPTAVKEVYLSRQLSRKPSDQLTALACAESASNFSIIGVAEKDAEKGLVEVDGLTLSVADTGSVKWPEPTSGCYKVSWQLADAFTKKGVSSHPWLIVYNDPSMEEFASEIKDQMTLANQAASVCLLSEAKAEQKCGVVICELDSSLLSKTDGAQYEKLQRLLLAAEEAVWVTRGAQKKPTNPDGSIVLGFTRTLRYELGTKIATLDLDPEADDEEDVEAQAGLVAEVAGRIGSSGEERIDMEFAEEDGMLLVPRLADNEAVMRICHAATGVGGPVEQPIDSERRLKLAFGRPGAVDTLYLEDDEDGEAGLGNDEIEVRVAATGVTADDARAAAGLKAGYTVGTECSGTVTRVGAGVDGLAVGDRVCCLTRDAFASFARLPASSAAKLPDDIPFDAAAALPADFTSAYYALVEEGRLHPGDRVLVNAAGSLGQATVQVATALNAQILLSPDDATPSGADLVINTDPADAEFVHKAWQSLAPFSRFVQLGVGDGASLTAPVVAGGNHSFAYASIDVVAAKRPRLMTEIWTKVLELIITKRVALSPNQLSVISFSQLPAALRDISSAPVTTTAKHVVLHKAGDRVKSTAAKLAAPSLKPDGCYIIVGGTGGLGRIITEWMITLGARTIFLLSRSTTPSPEVSQLIHRAEASGAHIALKTCDVANKPAVDSALASCTATHGPIRGVIHAAMVASKGTPFAETPHRDFAAALAPKVAGAWNLHAALAHQRGLDFFVLLSSTAGVLGMPGHVGYAAANTYLDGLAAFRARQNLPAAALALGFVLDAGHLAERADLSQLRHVGALDGEFVTSADVLALLGATIAGKVGSNCIIGIGFGGDGSAAKMDPKTRDARLGNLKLRGIGAGEEAEEEGPLFANGAGGEKGSSLFAELRRAGSREGALAFVLEALTKKVAALLLVPVEEVRAAKSTIELGLDSLTMMELLNWVATDLRTRLRMTDLFMVEGLGDLAAQILEKSGVSFEE